MNLPVYARRCRRCKVTRPEYWFRTKRIKTCAQCEGWEPVEPVPDGASPKGVVVREGVRVPRAKAKKLAEHVEPAPPWRFAYRAPKCRDCGKKFSPSRTTQARCPSCIMDRRERASAAPFERASSCAFCGNALPSNAHGLRRYCSNQCKWKRRDRQRRRGL